MRGHRTISFRQQPSGGEVRTGGPALDPQNVLTGSPRLVLLIHGFGNSEIQARDNFCAFYAAQERAGSPSRTPIAEVYWPGDVPVPLYFRSIRNARETAEQLAAALRRAARSRGGLTIDIVAHSMGCRLTLELIRTLENERQAGLLIRKVIFFAAAVPTHQLDHRQPLLREPFERSGVRALSMYSENDFVLGGTFPIGQWIADQRNVDQSGRPPVALGFRPWQPERICTRLSQCRISRAGHGDYWPDTGAAVTPKVRRFLELGRTRSPEQRDSPQRIPLVRRFANGVMRRLRGRSLC